jgi:restriction endonuclease S subunit
MNQPTYVSLGALSEAHVLLKGFPTSRTQEVGDVPCFSVAGLRNGDPARSFANYDDINDVGTDIARSGDVLLSVEGGTVGDSLVVDEPPSEFVPSQQAVIVRVTNQEILDPWFLAAWWTSEQGRSSLVAITQGAGIKRIPFRNLVTLKILLPELELQRDIGRRYRAFTKSIEAHQQVVRRLHDALTADVAIALAEIEDTKPESSGKSKETSVK